MIKFREHRETLEESMQTVREFENLSTLRDYINEKFLPYLQFKNISYYSIDKRINQALFAVYCKNTKEFKDGVYPIGFIFEEIDTQIVNDFIDNLKVPVFSAELQRNITAVINIINRQNVQLVNDDLINRLKYIQEVLSNEANM